MVDGKVHTEEIKELDYSINYYKNKVSFIQQLVATANTTLKGAVAFQICDDQKCLNPATENFQLKIEGLAVTAAADTTTTEDTAIAAAPVTQTVKEGDSGVKPPVIAATTGDGSDDLEKALYGNCLLPVLLPVSLPLSCLVSMPCCLSR